jgi:putative ABC transport system substrate-binding protein
MRRREFITLLGGVAVAWPPAARGERPERMRRIGVLVAISESDPEARRWAAAFQQGLEKLGWIDGRSARIDYRWGMNDMERARTGAAEILGLAPDVIVANASPSVAALHQATKAIPIVFVLVSDPIAQGFVQTLPRPGGNITGFANLEPTLGPKWLEMLKEIVPGVARAAIMFNPDNSGSAFVARSTAAAAPKLAVEAVMAPVRQPAEIDTAITKLGREAGSGLIVPPDGFTITHRKLIVELTARHRVPAIYSRRFFVQDGGLISYGNDVPGQFRRAARYVDRILRGEKPGDLPVQLPAETELVINLATAKVLGLDIPPTLLARADEVIE